MSLNLVDCLDISAAQTPDKTALIIEATALSYGEVACAAKKVANVLASRGVGRGDTVALMMPNIPQFALIYYGILYTGAAVVPINVLATKREILHQINDSGSKALFVCSLFQAEAQKALVKAETCDHLIVVETGATPEAPEVGDSFLKLMAGASAVFDKAQTKPEETAVIFYTAAMKGKALGAELSHFNMFQNALACKVFALKYYPEDVCLATLPLFHAFGQTAMMNAPFIAGATVVMIPKFEAAKVVEHVCRDRGTILGMVPAMFHLMMNYKKKECFDFSSMRWVVAGGAKMPVALAREFEERFGAPVVEGYGLTETSPVVSFNFVESSRAGSVGRPIWGCEVQIVDEKGARLPAGAIGEIAIRGHNVMKGYRNRPELTRKAMRNGWFHTGDLGYLDEDGYIFITGLKKHLILRAGMNVYPNEVETVLEEHPHIKEAAVIGMPDPVRGEEVRAFVVFEDGRSHSARDLIGFCRAEMAAYKCPRKFSFLEQLPRTRSGAVDKELLRNAED